MSTYIPRDLEAVFKNVLAQSPAVAVTGPRQAGKSTMIRHVLPDHAYVTLDDPLVRAQALDDPDLLLRDAGDKVIVDEVQYAPSLLSHVKMRIDRDRSAKGRFILTGSQQFALTKGLSESLAGRIRLLEMMPFNLGERTRALGAMDSHAAFVGACLRGSFPELVVDPAIDSRGWHASYVQTYLEKDIRSIYDVGSLREFERFLRLLASRCGQELNLSTMAVDIGVAVNTLKRWISILEACRIVFLLPPFHANLGKRLIKAPKVYFLDTALVCFLTGLRGEDHLLGGPLAGPLFENFCVEEAVKTALAKGAATRFHHLRARAGLEVDLLVEGPNGLLHPFEFKLSSTPRPEMATGLERFGKEFSALRPEPGAVVSLAPRSGPLTRGTGLLTVKSFLAKIGELTWA
jgi:uncharacterized protein